jgi:adenosine deaminase
VLAELHLHVYGCIRPPDLLRHLAAREQVSWERYEAGMEAAFGTVPPVREILERQRQGDPGADRAFAELFVFGDSDAGNFDRFQAKFNLLIAGSATAERDPSPAAVAAEVGSFARSIRAAHRADGIAYAEYRTLLGRDLEAPADRAVLDTLLAAYHSQDGGLTERLAISLHRADPWAAWGRVQELALGPTGDALTGIDFCYREEGFPPKDQASFFATVADFNSAHPDRALAILYHVGESFRDKSLESAVRWVQEAAELGAHRLGHAIALGVDPEVFGVHSRAEPVSERRDQLAYDLVHQSGLRAAGVQVDAAAITDELADLASWPGDAPVTIHYDQRRLDDVRRRQDYAMARVRATGAVIEVCPTSNRRIGGIDDPRHHPVHRFLAAGLPVVVSSDDPGIFGTTLADELDWVCRECPGDDGLRQTLVDTAWASRSEVIAGRINAHG